MFRLVFTLDGESRTYLLDRERVTVGRMIGSDLALPEHTVSRNHAELTHTPEGWQIADLKSRNGTRVNDELVKNKVRLAPGDVITLGTVSLRFEEDPRDVVQLSSDEEGLIKEGTILRSVEAIQEELKPLEAKAPGALHAKDSARLARLSRILAVLSDVARTLISASDLEGLLEKILDVIFAHVPVRRGVIMLVDGKSGRLEPRAVRQAGGDRGAIQISSSIANKAFGEGLAVLSHDAQVDPRFKAGESIRFLGIRSALCVPLKLEDKVLGIIYADTPLKVKAFDDFDLDLLSALSGYAAMGIRQAELRAAVERERKAKARLERYHSPSVVNRILSAGDPTESGALRVKETVGTVLFADIVGFTAMTESMPPAEVALMLNGCFSRMTDVIFRHEGTLDKFIGDAVMAIFGAPIPSRDHAQRAVRCALDMRSTVDVLNREHPERPPILFRMGINTGPLVAGDIGSVRRMEYTVLGTTVNAASRLESDVAKPGQIVVGEETFELLKEIFAFKKIGSVKAKGLSKDLSAYEVKERRTRNPRRPAE
jgi:adenylate cyclase